MRAIARLTRWTVLTLLALPAAARAQTRLDPVQVSARAAEADRLDARAVALEDEGRRRSLGKAAGLREKSGRLRGADDPRAFTSLERAALLRHALYQRPAALTLMREAGDHAMARGDVFRAATAYVNVALIAAELGDADRMREYADKGALLAKSPLLSAQQRGWLEQSFAAGTAPGRALALAPAP